LAVSTPVLFPLHFSGYPDPATTLLLFWCFAWNARPWLRGILFSLVLFNHENALFALPWLVVDARPSDRPLRRTLIFLGVAGLGAAAYCAWRNFVYCHVAVRFTAGFYLRTGRIVKNLGRVDGLVPLGTIEAFRSLWFFPLLAVINAWRIRAWRSSLWIAAVVGSAGLQIVFAHDVSRLMGMAFPAVLFGAELFGERYGEKTLTLWLWLAVIINLALPAYDITPAGMIPLLPFW
jgi:hypothetical protein